MTMMKNIIWNTDLLKYFIKFFTEHPNSTENPQGYWAHCLFSLTNSMILLWFCLLGIVHSFFPFVFKFSTSSAIIRSFKKLVKSNRHKSELMKYGIPDIKLENE